MPAKGFQGLDNRVSVPLRKAEAAGFGEHDANGRNRLGAGEIGFDLGDHGVEWCQVVLEPRHAGRHPVSRILAVVTLAGPELVDQRLVRQRGLPIDGEIVVGPAAERQTETALRILKEFARNHASCPEHAPHEQRGERVRELLVADVHESRVAQVDDILVVEPIVPDRDAGLDLFAGFMEAPHEA